MKQVCGFTLLEVMVSIAILAVALTALLTFSGNTMIKSGRAERLLIATQLARQRMVEIELDLQKATQKGEFPDEKSEEGKFDEPYDDYSWKMAIRRVDLPAPVMGEKGSIQETVGRELTKEISKTVRELKLTVLWQELGEEQTYDLVMHIVKM
jgi:prepilin-type N-terminal cleavage/methylation domain-containing protein